MKDQRVRRAKISNPSLVFWHVYKLCKSALKRWPPGACENPCSPSPGGPQNVAGVALGEHRRCSPSPGGEQIWVPGERGRVHPWLECTKNQYLCHREVNTGVFTPGETPCSPSPRRCSPSPRSGHFLPPCFSSASPSRPPTGPPPALHRLSTSPVYRPQAPGPGATPGAQEPRTPVPGPWAPT